MKKWNNAELVALDLNETANGCREADFEGLGITFIGCIPVDIGCYHPGQPQPEEPTDPGRPNEGEPTVPTDLHS